MKKATIFFTEGQKTNDRVNGAFFLAYKIFNV